MSERLGEAHLELRTDDKGLNSGIRQAEKATVGLGKVLDMTGRRAQQLGKDLESAAAASKRVAAGVAQITAAELRMGAMAHAERAEDIAAYGAELDRVRAKYNPMFAAIQKYRMEVEAVREAHRTGAISADEMAAAISRERQASLASIAAIKGRTTAMRVSSVHGRQLSFQLIDIGQALATAPTMGIYALQNLGFQIAQIGQLYMGHGGFNQAIKDSAAQVATFAARMGPAALVIGVVAAALAGLTYEIDKASGVSVGFGDVALAVWQMTADAVSDLLLPAIQAISPTVSSVWDFTILTTKAGVNYLVGYYVGGFRAIKELWNNFPAVMADVSIGAANGVISGVEAMINATLDGIKRLIAEIPEWLLPDAVEKFAASRSAVNLGRFDNPNAGAAAGVGDAFMSGFDRDYAGELFSGLASRAVANAKRPTKEQEKEAKRQADAYKDLVRSSKQFIAAKELEASTIGMTEEAAARLRYEQELLNKAANDNITLSAQQKEELSGLAAEMSASESAVTRIRDAFEFAKDTTKGFFSDLSNGLKNGEGFWKSFADAASNAISKISDKLLDLAIEASFSGGGLGGLFAGLGGGSGGGLGGLLGGLFSGFFADGGVIPQGKFGIVGEKGPEPVFGTSKGAAVLPNSALREASGGGGTVTLRVIGEEGKFFAPKIRAEAQGVAVKVVQDGLGQYDAGLPGRISDVMERQG